MHSFKIQIPIQLTQILEYILKTQRIFDLTVGFHNINLISYFDMYYYLKLHLM